MENRMVILKNMVNATVAIRKPEYNFNRRWLARGQSQAVPFDTLQQLLWDNSVRHMLESGILYIENLQDKIDLGLEPAGATEPVNIIVLSEQDMIDMWTKYSIDDFKRKVSHLPDTQIDNLIEYAVEKEYLDSQKCQFLKEITDQDILKSITRKRDAEEVDKREEERIRREREESAWGRR